MPNKTLYCAILLVCVLCGSLNAQPTTEQCTSCSEIGREVALMEQTLNTLQTINGRLRSIENRLESIENRVLSIDDESNYCDFCVEHQLFIIQISSHLHMYAFL